MGKRGKIWLDSYQTEINNGNHTVVFKREAGAEVGVLEAVVGFVGALHLVDLSLIGRVEQGDALFFEQSQRFGNLILEHVEEPL